MLEALDALFDTLLFLPSVAHPWDYVGHFAVNFLGVSIGYYALTFLKASHKVSALIAFLFWVLASTLKEIDDFGSIDGPYDMTANAMGIILAFALLRILENSQRTKTFHRS